ncbi:MAG: replicative DNA helicase [Alphaproteobacteria bacterium]|nr:replicative DNA helicase [Alphaproteobacteria bacterium]HCQ71155.1 replicative DNA helicase [Rhodospirillaceae bacterium]|tara:strand:- start:8324 stop:9820 length:1497 start_codon:yes stop_codon:yes gene_type:complete
MNDSHLLSNAVPYNQDGSPEGNNPHYRSLPHNQDAEQGLLGALLVDNRAVERVSEIVQAPHFYVPVHQRIYEAIIKMTERGQEASPVTLKNYFDEDPDLEELGGASYLAELAASVLTVVNVEDYARRLYDLFMRRELISLGEGVVNDSYSHTLDSDAEKIIETAESQLFSLAESGSGSGGFVTLRDSVVIAIEHAEKAFNADDGLTGVTSGLIDVDKKLGGFQKSDLLILAGRPSMGKTALATTWAYNAAKAYAQSGGKEGAVTAFFSLEMSADQLAGRILAIESGVSGDAIRKGTIQQSDFRSFVEASQMMSQVPLYIDDTPALSIGAVRTRARRLKRQHGLGLLVVDYLQLLRGSGSRQSSENRVLEVSEITRGLKAIAKELQIPVIALSQLSRAVEQREDKRPQLSDLRESGSIEQDADVVMFVYREEYYLARTEPEVGTDKHMDWQDKMDRAHNVGECIVAKARHGPIGGVRMHFDSNLTKFSDLEESRLSAEY